MKLFPADVGHPVSIDHELIGFCTTIDVERAKFYSSPVMVTLAVRSPLHGGFGDQCVRIIPKLRVEADRGFYLFAHVRPGIAPYDEPCPWLTNDPFWLIDDCVDTPEWWNETD